MNKEKALKNQGLEFREDITTKWGEIGAGLMIATIPTVIMYLLLSEQVQQSLVAGAVKG